mmetsp:Transcript_16427/g.41799  ORF Transcript_16427/g.41799 Transcript_16427/m.41799 type:complete len:234 (+) Transcript_16427:879-1580(+)
MHGGFWHITPHCIEDEVHCLDGALGLDVERNRFRSHELLEEGEGADGNTRQVQALRICGVVMLQTILEAVCQSPPVRGRIELIYFDEKVRGFGDARTQLRSNTRPPRAARLFTLLLDSPPLANVFLDAVDDRIGQKTFTTGGAIHVSALGSRIGENDGGHNGQSGEVSVEGCKHAREVSPLLGTHRTREVLVHESRRKGLPEFARHLGRACWTDNEGNVPNRDGLQRILNERD